MVWGRAPGVPVSSDHVKEKKKKKFIKRNRPSELYRTVYKNAYITTRYQLADRKITII